jgi:serine protease
VLLDQNDALAAGAKVAVAAAVGRLGGRPAGRSVPEIGLVTVQPPVGVSPAAFAALLRRLPGVASVAPEHRYAPRMVPNDPALSAKDPSSGVAWQWYLAREGFFGAWNLDRARGALVGVIDTGIDATHPDLQHKIVAAVDQQASSDSTGPADTDEVGHGTHVASLACADTDNGLGMAGAGYDCGLVIEKSDFSDSSIAASIVDATKRHVKALNMSFGPSTLSSARAPASEVRALDYAAARKVVLVAAAADTPSTEQGDPANVLQPAGTGPEISQGIGLDVTAAAWNRGRAPFAGSGSEISLAAYGEFKSGGGPFLPCTGQPMGILGAYPGNWTQLENFPQAACRVDLRGDSRYATVAGTSMAAPQVAATAAMMRSLNPYASLRDILRTLKQTAGRPPRTGWTSDLGWGILNANAALEAIRRVDRLAPVSKLFAPRLSRGRVFILTWSGHDQQRPQLIASRIAYYDVYVRMNGGRKRLIARTARHRLRFAGLPGHRYAFFLVAVDHAGNRQAHGARATTQVARGAR